jgi:hypothetical protein
VRYQSKPASCGPTALRNALQSRGILRSEDELALLVGCTAEGTSARGLLKAAHMIAVDEPKIAPGVLSERRGDVALLKLHAALRSGVAGILIVDSFEHWVTAFGLLGDDVIHVADSADPEMVLHYTPGKLLERWRGPGKAGYYGILL